MIATQILLMNVRNGFRRFLLLTGERWNLLTAAQKESLREERKLCFATCHRKAGDRSMISEQAIQRKHSLC